MRRRRCLLGADDNPSHVRIHVPTSHRFPYQSGVSCFVLRHFPSLYSVGRVLEQLEHPPQLEQLPQLLQLEQLSQE